jgi:CheY-like chemotaxis protein
MDTILLVDDDPAIREIFTVCLEMDGYKVLAAANGMECLNLLHTHNPDLIFLDLMMEPMDGWEILIAIRKNASSRYIPVIILTGKSPIPEDILKYGDLIEEYIVKPAGFSVFIESVHRNIENDRNLRREIEQMKDKVQDPALLDEYIHLLRFVRVAHKLKKRLMDPLWTDRVPLKSQEERLQWVHKKIGFPYPLSGRDEGK